MVSATSNISNIVIIYASQTGQAKAIAEGLNDQAISEGFEPKLHCISRADKDFKLNEIKDPVVFVCSTTGDGEVPETALKCWGRLKRLDTETNKAYLSNLKYALLGLGDTNYTQFCNGPKLFHKRFQELGAKCFYGPFWADDGTGLENEVEPFKEGLWDALGDFLNEPSIIEIEHELKKLTLNPEVHATLNYPDLVESYMSVEYTPLTDETRLDSLEKNLTSIHSQAIEMGGGFFEAAVTSNKIITSTDSEKSCFCLEFIIHNDNNHEFKYEPGYAIEMICPNNDSEIDNLLNRLDVDKDKRKNTQVTIKSNDSTKKTGLNYCRLTENTKMNLEQFFRYCVDIRSACLKKNFLRMLASYCSDEKEKQRLLELSSREGSEQYLNMVKESHLTLLDILNIFKSCKPDLGHVIQMLPVLCTRSYTMCSYHSDVKEEKHPLQVVFNLVKFNKDKGRTYERNGIATDYLSKLQTEQRFYFIKRRFHMFTFPELSNEAPLLMIGPGTGIAPFMSYLRYRKKLNANIEPERMSLFYGCRHPEKDFLFKDEVINFSDMLQLNLSFSRFNEYDKLDDKLKKSHLKDSKYVQDTIRQQSKSIIEMIHDKNGFIYICGDAKNMSKDVLACFEECLTKELGLNPTDAKKYFMDMMKNKRYKQDIWA